MRKFKYWSDIAAIWVTILGVFFGGISAFIEYSDKLYSDRIKVTLEYVTRFNSAPLREARSKVEQFWDTNAETVFKKSDESEEALRTFVVDSIRNQELADDTELIIEFFEDIHVCVHAKICDETTAIRFFGKQSYDFYGINFPYIAEQRRRTKDEFFGCGVESFKKSYKTGKSIYQFSCTLNKASP